MRLLSTLLMLLSLSLAMPAHAASKPEQVVDGFYKALVSTMKVGPKLGFDGRRKQLTPALTKAFDMPLMTRYAVGPSWSKATKAQQTELIEAFSDFSISTYASRFTKYDGEVFKVLDSKATSKTAYMVNTHLIPKGEKPVKLSYLVRKDKAGVYRISDVYLDASISELATRRSEFSSVIKRDGIPALITTLKDKVKVMREKTVK